MESSDYAELWFQQKAVPGAAFRLNDSVLITNGEHTGQLRDCDLLTRLNPLYLLVAA
jgi:hypothetical protein